MRDEPDLNLRSNILDDVINLLDDAQDFSWVSAKASHAILLCRMEQGEITSWSDTDKIDRIRRVHAQRYAQAQNNIGKTQGKNHTKIILCVNFNKILAFRNKHMRQKVCFTSISPDSIYQIQIWLTYDAPMIWNDLPDEVRSANSLASFRSKLKSYLFGKAYPP